MFGNKMDKVAKAIEKNNAGMLIQLTENNDPSVRLAAIAGLGKVGGDETSNCLITLLHSEDKATRLAVAQALGELGDMHTKAHLAAQLSKETDPEVHEAMSKAMSSIKGY